MAVLAILGVIFGIGLAFASRVFHVHVDPRLERVTETLPGINCGACGYAGCEAYADAVVHGERPDLCMPGGQETALALAHIMGQKLDEERRPVRAVVHCQGDCEASPNRYVYDGIPDCRAAHALQGGPKLCEYGCLGYGSCARACPFGAITMSEERLPVIDRDVCTGCGTCVRTCPRDLIETLPQEVTIALACSNRGPAKEARRVCTYGCIKCRKCVRVSEEETVEMIDNLPRLSYEPGADYGPAMEACPQDCFVKVLDRGFERKVREEAAKV